MKQKSVVLLFEQRTVPHLIDGQPPVVPYSHDQPLLHFGHESLRKGFKVYYANSTLLFGGQLDVTEITQAYPVFQSEKKSTISIKKLSPDFIVTALPSLSGERKLCPKAKIIAFLPSSVLLEFPKDYSPEWLEGYMMAARHYVDFYVTQNGRMADLAINLFCLIARVDLRERILSAHLGIVKEQKLVFPPRKMIREEMMLGPDDIAFINAGGPWCWTDYNTFLQAFCNVVRSDVTNMKFYVMGFSQPGNNCHDAYIAETKKILKKNADLVGKNIIVYDDWYKASAKVVQFTHAADVGVNVSKDTAENWQSYRVRFLEYMKAGIPVINTSGDYLSANDAANAIYLVTAGNIPSYEQAIREATINHELRKQKTKAMKDCAKKFDSRITYGRLIDKLIELPKRNFKNPKEWTGVSLFADEERTEWDRLSEKQVKDYPLIAGGKRSLYADWFLATGRGQKGECAAMPFDLPKNAQLKSKDKIMTVGFTLTPRRPIARSEVIQIGPARNETRLLVLASGGGAEKIKLTLFFFTEDGRSKNIPIVACGNKGPVEVVIQALPRIGLIRIKINSKAYHIVTKPWHWNGVKRLWLGSRRLTASACLDKVWLTAENVTGADLNDLKIFRKPSAKE